jgi:hypothetical protein
MIDYAKIISINYPNKQWLINGDSYDGLDWKDESAKPTKAELDALWDATQSAFIAKQEAEVAAKESALSKLTALGLTADEVKALLGVK